MKKGIWKCQVLTRHHTPSKIGYLWCSAKLRTYYIYRSTGATITSIKDRKPPCPWDLQDDMKPIMSQLNRKQRECWHWCAALTSTTEYASSARTNEKLHEGSWHIVACTLCPKWRLTTELIMEPSGCVYLVYRKMESYTWTYNYTSIIKIS